MISTFASALRHGRPPRFFAGAIAALTLAAATLAPVTSEAARFRRFIPPGHFGGFAQRDFGRRDFGERNFGRRDFFERDFGRRDFGERNFGRRDFGERDFGRRDFGRRDFDRRFDRDFDRGDFVRRRFFFRRFAFDGVNFGPTTGPFYDDPCIRARDVWNGYGWVRRAYNYCQGPYSGEAYP